MNKTILTLVTLAFIGLSTTNAQVGIGTTDPEESSALDVEATDKGLLPPRMTEAERNAISNPAAGLLIWCTNCGGNGEMQVYNGSNWTNMTGGAASEAPPQVGDYRDGGVVFYVAPTPTDLDGDGTDDQGLVCAVDDQSSGSKWGCYNTDLNGNNASAAPEFTAIGKGQTNTTFIVNNCGEAGIAAKVCDNYSVTVGGTTYDDWFLPSKDELNEMYQNKSTIDSTAGANGGSSFDSVYYWSSTEDDGFSAWRETFASGNPFPGSKGGQKRVRAVRAF
jgi:hypothetical protein